MLAYLALGGGPLTLSKQATGLFCVSIIPERLGIANRGARPDRGFYYLVVSDADVSAKTLYV
jgi:hypothetical protein